MTDHLNISHIVDEISFIDNNLKTISDLRDRVLKAHENLEKIGALASTWNNVPLYQGKERKYDCLIPLEDREVIREARYREMVDAADKILRLVAVISTKIFYFHFSQSHELSHIITVIRCDLRGN